MNFVKYSSKLASVLHWTLMHFHLAQKGRCEKNINVGVFSFKIEAETPAETPAQHLPDMGLYLIVSF